MLYIILEGLGGVRYRQVVCTHDVKTQCLVKPLTVAVVVLFGEARGDHVYYLTIVFKPKSVIKNLAMPQQIRFIWLSYE